MNTLTVPTLTDERVVPFQEQATHSIAFLYENEVYIAAEPTPFDLEMLSHTLYRRRPLAVVLYVRIGEQPDGSRVRAFFKDSDEVERLRLMFEHGPRRTFGPSIEPDTLDIRVYEARHGNTETLHVLGTFFAFVHKGTDIVVTGNADTFLIDYQDASGEYHPTLATALHARPTNVYLYTYLEPDHAVEHCRGALHRTPVTTRRVVRKSVR